MKSFIAKRVNSILVNLRYLKFMLLNYKETNKKICNTFDHIFKTLPLYTCIMRKVSLKRYYFVLLYNGAITLTISKKALNPFCDKMLQIFIELYKKKSVIRELTILAECMSVIIMYFRFSRWNAIRL